jgi:hypothetical protein
MPPTFATNNGGSGNTIDVWEIDPDFATPADSTIAEVARIPVSAIDGDICPAVRERCIDQPGSGTGTAPNNVTFLEAISDTLMHRLQLRDFGFDEDGRRDKRAVVSATVDANGKGKAGIHWYEFRNNGSGWGLYQENTFSPDRDHRWMGSIAMNRKGETCLGYSISSQDTHPSIGIAGRTGPSPTFNVRERVVFDGNVDGFVQPNEINTSAAPLTWSAAYNPANPGNFATRSVTPHALAESASPSAPKTIQGHFRRPRTKRPAAISGNRTEPT